MKKHILILSCLLFIPRISAMSLGSDSVAGPFLFGAVSGVVPGGCMFPGFVLVMLAADSQGRSRDTATKSFGTGMLIGTLAEAVILGMILNSEWYRNHGNNGILTLEHQEPGFLGIRTVTEKVPVPAIIANDIALKLLELIMAFH